MLFNCFKCGKSISTKRDICVYCKSDISQFAAEFSKERLAGTIREKYTGTFLALLARGKIKSTKFQAPNSK